MTSQEVGQLCGGFLAQVRGIFAGIEKLPAAFEELERREQELPTKAARVKDLDQQIANKTEQLAHVDETVRTKREHAQAQQQKGLVAALASLHGQIADEEAKLAALRAESAGVNQDLNAKKALLATIQG